VVTPPHRKFKKNAPPWYEERHEQQRKAHSSRRIHVEHGIAHLKNWRALARHLGRRDDMSDIVQAVAGLLSHQQTATLRSQPPSVNTDNATHPDVPRPTVHEAVNIVVRLIVPDVTPRVGVGCPGQQRCSAPRPVCAPMPW
jgi:hypothetical protein